MHCQLPNECGSDNCKVAMTLTRRKKRVNHFIKFDVLNFFNLNGCVKM